MVDFTIFRINQNKESNDREVSREVFSPRKKTTLRRELSTFFQADAESMYEAQKWYKEVLRTCPHYRLLDWIQVDYFKNLLSQNTRNMLDAAANRIFMNKLVEEGKQLLEQMTTNAYQWSLERNHHRRVAEVHHVDQLTHVTAQIEALGRKFDVMQVKSMPYDFCS